MALLIALEVVIAGDGLVGAATAGPSATDPMARVLAQIGWRGDVTISGSPQIVTDATGDEAHGTWPEADLVSGEYAVAPDVPPWVLDELFPCQTLAFCSSDVGTSAYGHGAILVMLEVSERPDDIGLSDSGEWGPLFTLPGTVTAPAGGSSYALSTVAFVTRVGPQNGEVHRLVYGQGDFQEARSSARSVWFGDILVTVIPMDEVEGGPSGWDGLASVEGAREIAATRDWLRTSQTSLLPFSNPPTLTFHAEAGASP
jgi:hypothetical protein